MIHQSSKQLAVNHLSDLWMNQLIVEAPISDHLNVFGHTNLLKMFVFFKEEKQRIRNKLEPNHERKKVTQRPNQPCSEMFHHKKEVTQI